MLVETLQYTKKDGWSSDFPPLDSDNTLILVFAAAEFINYPEPIKELASHYPLSNIVGCSSAGEIHGMHVLEDSITVAITKFQKTKLQLSSFTIDDAAQSYDVGKSIAIQLMQKDLRSIFVLSDGLNVNGSELVRGLNAENKQEAVITGGLAGDGSRFKQTWLISKGEPILNKVIAIGFYGDHIQIGHGSRGGWDIFGCERRITRSKDNILYELDGKSALALYKEYLGTKADGLPATGLLFPLSIRKDTHDTKQLVRTLLAIDEKEGSLTFAGDMPTGNLAQLMRANFDRLITGAKDAAQLSQENIDQDDESPLLLIAISCVGRRLLLGERTSEEVESVMEIFPEHTKLVGFYSYGEISPFTEGDCDLHNQTMTLTTIKET